jgi:hypothetical protein
MGEIAHETALVKKLRASFYSPPGNRCARQTLGGIQPHPVIGQHGITHAEHEGLRHKWNYTSRMILDAPALDAA